MVPVRAFVRLLLTTAAVLALAGIGVAQPRDERLPRIAIDEPVSRPAAAELQLRAPDLPVPVLARVSGNVESETALLEARLAQHASRKTPVWLAVAGPSEVAGVEPWRTALHGLLSRHKGGIAIVEIQVAGADARVATYAVRLAATDIRAERDTIAVAIGGPAAAAAYTTELAPYLDLLVLENGADLDAAERQLARVDPGARLAVTGMTTDADGPARMIESELTSLGTGVVLHAWSPSPGLAPALRALSPLTSLLEGEISPLDAKAAGLALAQGSRDVTGSLRHRLLFDERTFATYLVYWSPASADLLQLSLTLPVDGAPGVRRLSDGQRLPVTDYHRVAETGLTTARVPLPGGPVLINFSEGATEVLVQRSGVSAARQLTVEEIIARHQLQQRAQDTLVRSYIAEARMDQHFRPNMADPGYDVASTNRYFVSGDEVEWEELSFSVNGTKWGPDRPSFPLLQAEKVLSLPLQLRFGNDYRYRLAGTERVGDYDCYVVRFDPVEKDRSLYRGTVWIERRTFARVKVQAVQTALSAPVVSNEEIQTYAPVASIGNRPVFLFTGLTARQIMLIAGRNLLVEKSVAFTEFRVNPDNFEGSREEARRSDRIMYRETERGLRYYVKDGQNRVISDQSTQSARAMAMGVTLDPSYAFPLPILGINYLDFAFKGPDSQLAILFAGVLAAGNIQRPKLGKTPFDASVDFFAIAVPSSDRLYDAGGEHEPERLLTWPLTTGLNLGWQYTPFQKLSGNYQFRFDGFTRDTTTSETYLVPASTISNGVGAGWEYRRGGYSAVVNGAWYARSGWREWGVPGQTAAGLEPSYAKYTASLSRDVYFNLFHKIHLNGAWFGGRDLDRFAKYQFGMFDDTRIHGVPASGVRFQEVALARGSYSFNIFEQYRLDLFLERAWGRDRAFDATWQPITGLGAAISLRAPKNTILRADFGKSFLPDRYRGIGSATLQVMILKPLK
ncbi:MAG: hypothetical protein ABIX28_11455 [Vicinamibacterales bacterium]